MSPTRSIRRLPRRAGASLLGVAALAFVALSPAGASADGTGTVAIGASLCESVAAADTPENCPKIPLDGDFQIVSEDSSIVLTNADSNVHGAVSVRVWGENNTLPYGLYFIDNSGMQVPAGYQLWNYVAIMGDTGGSEFGLYANLTSDQPNAQLDFVMVPTQVDSDGDGASDDAEIDFGSDPNDPTSFPAGQAGPQPYYDTDADGDGLTDFEEAEVYGTDPSSADTDLDGAPDSDEVAFGSDPFDPSDFPSVQAGPEPSDDTDADGDTLTDVEEVEIYGTDPNSTDTDGDGVSDYDEVWAGIDPLDPNVYPGSGPSAGPELGSDVDTDGDGADDIIEAAYGSDPNDSADHPRPTSAEGTSAAVTQAIVTQLPNTGAGNSSADGSLGSIIAAALGAAALAIFGAVANRRRA